MNTVNVKCHAHACSQCALMIYDEKCVQAYIPFQYVIKKQYHEVTKEICSITIPTWLAIDRKLNYEGK